MDELDDEGEDGSLSLDEVRSLIASNDLGAAEDLLLAVVCDDSGSVSGGDVTDAHELLAEVSWRVRACLRALS